MSTRTQCDGCGELLAGNFYHGELREENAFAPPDGEQPNDWDWCRPCRRMASAALSALLAGGGRLEMELPEVAIVSLAGGGEYLGDVAGLPIVLTASGRRR